MNNCEVTVCIMQQAQICEQSVSLLGKNLHL